MADDLAYHLSPWRSPPASGWDTTRSCAPSAPAEWARSIARAIRGWIATSPSRCSRPTLASREPAALARFEREAMSVARLSHPNILSIFEFARDGDTAFVVTELVEGETLRARLDERPAAAPAGGGVRPADRAGHGRGARARHRASRSQARERDDHARRPGQDSRLRPRQAGGHGRRPTRRTSRDEADQRRHRARHVRLHGAGTGARTGGRSPRRHVRVRRRALRDAHRRARVQGGDRRRHDDRGPDQGSAGTGHGAAGDLRRASTASSGGASRSRPTCAFSRPTTWRSRWRR